MKLILAVIVFNVIGVAFITGCNTKPTKDPKECTPVRVHVSEMTKHQYEWCKGLHCEICAKNNRPTPPRIK